MKHTVRRLFFVWNFEKQISWLNEMSKKGLHLTDVDFGKFVFEDGAPGEYAYRMEWLKEWPGHPKSVAYIRFLEEAGVEYVGSFKKWAYFRKKAAEGAFDLFSDLDSRISHIKRLMTLVLCLLPFLVVSLAFNLWEWARHQQSASLVVSFMLAAMLLFLLAGFTKMAISHHRYKNERILRE